MTAQSGHLPQIGKLSMYSPCARAESPAHATVGPLYYSGMAPSEGYGACCSHMGHMAIKWQSHRCHWQLRPKTPEPPATVLIAHTPLPCHKYFIIVLMLKPVL